MIKTLRAPLMIEQDIYRNIKWTLRVISDLKRIARGKFPYSKDLCMKRASNW